MNPEAIRELLNRRPFQPFEAVSTAGQVHTVRHPEMAMLTKSQMVIASPETDRVVVIAFLHIAELRVLQPA